MVCRRLDGEALSLGARSAEAVRYLLRNELLGATDVAGMRLLVEEVSANAAAHFHRPQPSLSGYDSLLGQPASVEVAG